MTLEKISKLLWYIGWHLNSDKTYFNRKFSIILIRWTLTEIGILTCITLVQESLILDIQLGTLACPKVRCPILTITCQWWTRCFTHLTCTLASLITIMHTLPIWILSVILLFPIQISHMKWIIYAASAIHKICVSFLVKHEKRHRIKLLI